MQHFQQWEVVMAWSEAWSREGTCLKLAKQEVGKKNGAQ